MLRPETIRHEYNLDESNYYRTPFCGGHDISPRDLTERKGAKESGGSFFSIHLQSGTHAGEMDYIYVIIKKK